MRSVLRLLLWALWLVAGTAQAVQVQVQAVDEGAGTWRYDYVVQGDFAEFEGLNLLFDPAAYGPLSLVHPPLPGGGFTQYLAQPDAGLGAEGLLALTAQRSVSATESFTVSVGFRWLGAQPPGVQPYEVFDANFTKTGESLTSALPAVPEPASAALMLGGLAFVLGWSALRRGLVRRV